MSVQKITLISSSHLSSNPRLVKEAKALFEAKFSVSIIFLQHISYLEKFDKEIIDDLPGINFSAINYNRLYWKGKILNAKRLFRRFYSKIFHSSCYKENIFFPEFKKLIKLFTI